MHRNLKFLHMTIFLHMSGRWYRWQIWGILVLLHFCIFAFLHFIFFVFLCKVEAKPGRGCTSNGGLLRALASLLFRTASPARHYFLHYLLQVPRGIILHFSATSAPSIALLWTILITTFLHCTAFNWAMIQRRPKQKEPQHLACWSKWRKCARNNCYLNMKQLSKYKKIEIHLQKSSWWWL